MLAAAASCLGIQDFFYRKIYKLIQYNPYACYLKEQIAGILNISIDDLVSKCTQSRLQEIMKYGFPGTADLLANSDYILSFDRRNRVPHWVCEHLRADCVAPTDPANWHKPRGASRRRAEFQSDMRVPSLFRVDVNDYWNTGYDRGHLAASGNHQGQQINCDETFLMTNITPQVGQGFNRDAWNNLEIYVRELTERYGSVYVYSGPLYLPRNNGNSGCLNVEFKLIGAHAVAVPTHFFKIVIVEPKLPKGKPYMEAYVMPNAYISDQTDLRTFLTDIREIERLSGLKFFEGIRHADFFASNYPRKLDIYENFT